MNAISFTKMTASGNDFIVVERRAQETESREVLKRLAKNACDRKYGIGADGLLVLEPSEKADIRMRIFNPDGSEAQMCGNGARCCAKYFSFRLAAVSSQPIEIETKAGVLRAYVDEDTVKLKMSEPHGIRLNFKLTSGGESGGSELEANYINTGVPHTVIFVDDLDKADVLALGRKIRFHQEFAPDGSNVDFTKVLNNDTIAVRTYERGVEAETEACGTGAAASAIISRVAGLINSNAVNVKTRSAEILKVCFDGKLDKISNVWLEGSAKIIHKGEYYV